MACSCSNARIPCSEFCGYQESCQNRWNLVNIDMDDWIEIDDDSKNGDKNLNIFYRCMYIWNVKLFNVKIILIKVHWKLRKRLYKTTPPLPPLPLPLAKVIKWCISLWL